MLDLSKIYPVSTSWSHNGFLMVSGYSLRDLAEEFGTPLYLYDEATFVHQVERLRVSFEQNYPGEWRIAYAAKAYLSLAFAKHLVDQKLGIDVISLAEMEIARQAGFPAESVHLHGNNKSAEELRAALHWQVHSIVVDSLDELHLLENLASEANICARIWLRISPEININTHPHLQTGHSSTKFGLGIENGQAGEAIARAMKSQWLNLTGLHTHLGSQIRQPEPYCMAVQRLMSLAEAYQFSPLEISPGGGWGVPYSHEEPDDDPIPWISAVAETVQEGCRRRRWPLPVIVVEPGRWLAARAGVALYKVGAIKTAADGTLFLAVDGGMADNLRPALYGAKYMACMVDRDNSGLLRPYHVVGRYCESGDFLVQEAWLPEARRGDLLLIPCAGAYHLSMASNYNLTPRPAVLWLKPGAMEIMQQRERIAEKSWWTGE